MFVTWFEAETHDVLFHVLICICRGISSTVGDVKWRNVPKLHFLYSNGEGREIQEQILMLQLDVWR